MMKAKRVYPRANSAVYGASIDHSLTQLAVTRYSLTVFTKWPFAMVSRASCVFFIWVLMLGLSPRNVDAKLYKWIDADGNVSYSEQKPPDVTAQEIKVRGAEISTKQAREALDELRTKADDQHKNRQLSGEVESEEMTRDDRIKKNCDTAKENLRVLETAPRVKGTDADGNLYFLDDAARKAKIDESKRQVTDYCG